MPYVSVAVDENKPRHQNVLYINDKTMDSGAREIISQMGEIRCFGRKLFLCFMTADVS